jgi:hypothetical protein
LIKHRVPAHRCGVFELTFFYCEPFGFQVQKTIVQRDFKVWSGFFC